MVRTCGRPCVVYVVFDVGLKHVMIGSVCGATDYKLEVPRPSGPCRLGWLLARALCEPVVLYEFPYGLPNASFHPSEVHSCAAACPRCEAGVGFACMFELAKCLQCEVSGQVSGVIPFEQSC